MGQRNLLAPEEKYLELIVVGMRAVLTVLLIPRLAPEFLPLVQLFLKQYGLVYTLMMNVMLNMFGSQLVVDLISEVMGQGELPRSSTQTLEEKSRQSLEGISTYFWPDIAFITCHQE